MQISYHYIEDALKKSKKGDIIEFIKHGNDKVRKSYYDGFREGTHWVKYNDGGPVLSTEVNGVNLFPNKQVEILKIGKNTVESKFDYKDRVQAMKMVDKENRNKQIKTKYRDAYIHNKKTPNNLDESKNMNEVRMIVRRLIDEI